MWALPKSEKHKFLFLKSYKSNWSNFIFLFKCKLSKTENLFILGERFYLNIPLIRFPILLNFLIESSHFISLLNTNLGIFKYMQEMMGFLLPEL